MALSKLINLGGTEVLIKHLINSQHADPVMIEVLVQEVLWLLGQVIYFPFFSFFNKLILKIDNFFLKVKKMLKNNLKKNR